MRRIQFAGYLERMNPSRLSHQIYTFLQNKATRLEKDLIELGSPNLKDRKAIKKIIQTRGFEEQERKPTRSTWTEERKLAQSLRMKNYWA